MQELFLLLLNAVIAQPLTTQEVEQEHLHEEWGIVELCMLHCHCYCCADWHLAMSAFAHQGTSGLQLRITDSYIIKWRAYLEAGVSSLHNSLLFQLTYYNR